MRTPAPLPIILLAILILALGALGGFVSHPARAMNVVQQATGTMTTTPTGTFTAQPITITPTGTATGMPLSAYPAIPPAPVHKRILIKERNGSYVFSPKKTTVMIGTTVTWRNTTGAAQSVTSTTAGWKYHKSLRPGQHVSFVFLESGTYTYRSALRPTMSGRVVVHP